MSHTDLYPHQSVFSLERSIVNTDLRHLPDWLSFSSVMSVRSVKFSLVQEQSFVLCSGSHSHPLCAPRPQRISHKAELHPPWACSFLKLLTCYYTVSLGVHPAGVVNFPRLNSPDQGKCSNSGCLATLHSNLNMVLDYLTVVLTAQFVYNVVSFVWHSNNWRFMEKEHNFPYISCRLTR